MSIAVETEDGHALLLDPPCPPLRVGEALSRHRDDRPVPEGVQCGEDAVDRPGNEPYDEVDVSGLAAVTVGGHRQPTDHEERHIPRVQGLNDGFDRREPHAKDNTDRLRESRE